jgi:hypothetical protein
MIFSPLIKDTVVFVTDNKTIRGRAYVYLTPALSSFDSGVGHNLILAGGLKNNYASISHVMDRYSVIVIFRVGKFGLLSKRT